MKLVTGATGHIGNVLARRLVEDGEKVRALALPGEDLSTSKDLDIEWVVGNVLDLPCLECAFEGVDTVYHLAGVISIMPGKNEMVQQVNLQGTRHVLQAAQKAGVRRLVYTSSIHALNRAPHGVVIDESVPFDPEHAISAYDRSKALASLEVLEAARQGLDAVIACPTGVIGPYDYRGSEMGHVIRDAMNPGAQLCIEGAYDFVDVRDVADGLVRAAEKGRRGESYILSGERITYRQILETVRQVTGSRLRLLHIPLWLARFAAHFAPTYYRLTHSRPRLTPYSLATVASNSVISSAKARRELGFAPRPLSESIADTVRWLFEQRKLAAPVLQRER
ncbi:MAG: SDR family oxidoreductase [Anaerolineales bacterium]|nr:SDR family oxidoreductase [Anaerolineales bacterium]